MRRDLSLGLVDAAGLAAMAAFGEQYLGPLALALGVDEARSGLVVALPFMLGAVAALATPGLVRRAGGYRRPVVALATLQGLALTPLIAACLVGSLSFPALVVVLASYFGAGLGTLAPWMAWVGELVPGRVRPRFFAARALLARVVTGLGLLAAGGLLEWATARGARLEGFAALLTLAAIARLVSAAALARHTPVAVGAGDLRDVTLAEFFSPSRGRQDAGVVLSLLALVGAVAIWQPLLPALLLEQRQLGYASWSLLTATPFLARIVALPVAGRLASRVGPRPLLISGVALAGLVPVLWVVPGGIGYLLVVAALEGIAGAAYTLGGFLLLFEALRREELCAVMAKFVLAMGLALALGAGLGSGLLSALDASLGAYRVVFGLGGLATLGALALLPRPPAS